MKKIVVLGAGGQLGKALQEISTQYGECSFFFKSKKEVTILSKEQIKKLFQEKFDVCINCAAYTDVEKAETNEKEAYAANEIGVSNLVDVLLKHNIPLIHVSTSYIFDGTKNTPYIEEDTPNPINLYGRSKLAGEEIILKNLKDYYIVRTSWVYSKWGNNFFSRLTKNIAPEETILAENTQIGTPTKAEKLARSILDLFVLNAPYGIYHCSGSKKMTAYTFAQKIVKKRNLSNKIMIPNATTLKQVAKRPVFDVLDNHKINTFFKKHNPQ